MRARRAQARPRSSSAPYVMLAPFLLLFVVFDLVPVIGALWLSLWEWSPLGEQVWIGLDNYLRLSTDPRFWIATGNTVAIMVLAGAPQIVAGAVLAHAMNAVRVRYDGALRLSLLVPFITSGAAITIIVAQLVDPDYGMLTRTLEWWGFSDVNLLASPLGAWVVVSATVSWRWFGFTALMYTALLSAVSRDVYRAAELDGAGPLSQLRYITLPFLRPGIAFTLVTSTIGLLQLFTEPLLIEPGSPTCGPARQCQTLALLIYELGFRDYQFGYASAVTIVVMLLSAGVVVVFAVMTRRRHEPAGTLP